MRPVTLYFSRHPGNRANASRSVGVGCRLGAATSIWEEPWTC